MGLSVTATIVGHTRRGKVLYCTAFENLDVLIAEYYRTLPIEDLFDAYAVFEFLAIRQIRRAKGPDDWSDTYSLHSWEIRR